MNQKNRSMILIGIFLSMFVIGTILIFTTPSSVKITYGLTTETEDGVTIVFNVFEPKTGGTDMKPVIIGHGGMATKEFLKGYAIELANAGFIVVNFDFRAHGQSGGELNLSLLINDVKVIKQYLSARPDVDITNLSYIGYSMGGYPGVQIVKNDTDFKCFIGIGTGLPHADYLPGYVVPANSSRRLNVLMIQARFDEGISLDELKEGMGLRLNMPAADIDVNKLYGTFPDGNASMIYLDDNSDHLLLAWDEDFIREARDWISNTFPDVRAVDENFYANLRGLILILQVFGGLGFFFMISTPLSNFIVNPKKEDIHRIELPDETVNGLIKKSILYSFLFGVPGALIVSPVLIFLPLTIAGLMVTILFSQAFGILILLWRTGKQAKVSLKAILKEPFKGSREQLLRHIGLGAILATVLYIILYLSFGLNYIGMAPGLSKLPWLPIYFALNVFTILVLTALSQLILQPMLENGHGLLKTAIVVFGVIMIYIATLTTVACIIMGNYFIIIFLYIITPVSLLTAFVSVVLYQKTGNNIAGTIVNALYITALMCTLAPYLFILTNPSFIISM
ncbi:MAG: alpha/beta hydrolase [Candidatus Helarchaeota archaeon]|nr:alpha/beta hydrolase [Candidatus Helarchaeota archaeon]